MPQPFLLFIAAILALAGCLVWKQSLWNVPTWLAVQLRKCLFSLNLYDSINDMKHLWTVWISPQPCQSYFCCGLLPIWPKLDVWAENGAYCLSRLGWWYNREKLYIYWPYMTGSMIWNNLYLSELHLSRATVIFVVDCCQFGPNWMFGLKKELMACAELVDSTTDLSCLFTDIIWYYQWY